MAKILHIVADGALGGGTTAVLGLCEDLHRIADIRVFLITQPHSPAAAEASKLDLNIHTLDFFTSRFDFRLPKKLKAIIHHLNPDLIHIHGSRAAHAMASSIFKKMNTPLIYTVHGYHFIQKSLPMKFLGWLAERRISARMDHTVFVSNADHAHAARYGFLVKMKSSSIVHNGINFDKCDDLANTPKTHDLVFMGRMCRQKNPFLMIDIMAALQSSPYRLLMIGGGEMEAEVRAYALKKNVADRIDFTGPLRHDEALRSMAAARVFVLPSLWEGLPIAPIEAMACGLPVVASHIGGTDEVVGQDSTGLLIKGFNAHDYAAAIHNILENEDIYQRFSQQGQRVAKEKFARKRNSDAYIDIYCTALAIRLFPAVMKGRSAKR